jgi:outer membrane autotransporter protein
MLLASDDIEVNKNELVKNLTAIAPDESPAVQSNAISTFNTVASAVGTRLSGGLGSPALGGLSSGDTFISKNVWMQGLYNTSKLNNGENNGFNSHISGVAFGIEGKFNNYLIAGISYAYTNSNINGFERNTDVITNTFVLYGEYNDPLSFFVNGMMSLGLSKYNEIKILSKEIGNKGAKYNANTLAFQVGIGYEISNEVFNTTPIVSFYYIGSDTEAYTDTAGQKISFRKSNNLIGLASIKFDKEFIITDDFILRPEFKIGAGRDFVNNVGDVVVKVMDSLSYTIKEQTLKSTFFEIGIGVTGNINERISLSFNYEEQRRDDYVDKAYLFNVRIKF